MDGINRSGRKNVPNQKRCQGFSLIELSIALIIIGVVIVPVMKAYSVYRVQKARDDTYANRVLIEAALGDFYLKNGFYPCPARRNLPSDDPGYGVSVNCTPASLPAIGTCDVPGGVCRTTGNDEKDNPDYDPYDPGSTPTLAINPNVVIGGVPFATLGIPPENALDGWSRTMTYAVTESLTASATFDRYNGAIQVNTFDPADFAGGTATPVPADGFQNLHIFVASHGQNGAGAYNLNGTLYQACDVNDADGENCNDDGVFFDSLASGDLSVGGGNSAGAFHDDDIVLEITDVPTGIWTYARTNAQDAVTFRRVGIGTDQAGIILDASGAIAYDSTGSPRFNNNIMLDVSADIAATRMRADEMCDLAGENCFSAEALGSTETENPVRIQCPDNSIMTGIANGMAVCQPRFPLAMADQTCPAGQYVRAINAGVIQCAVP